MQYICSFGLRDQHHQNNTSNVLKYVLISKKYYLFYIEQDNDSGDST